MDDLLTRFWNNIVDRLSGPMWFRFLFQPAMATLYAVRDGVRDAREGRPAYFWTIFHNRAERRALLHEGGKAVGRVIVLGTGMDVAYQLIVFRWLHPLELVFIVLGLAFVPYLLMRGPVNRIASRWVRAPKVGAP